MRAVALLTIAAVLLAGGASAQSRNVDAQRRDRCSDARYELAKMDVRLQTLQGGYPWLLWNDTQLAQANQRLRALDAAIAGQMPMNDAYGVMNAVRADYGRIGEVDCSEPGSPCIVTMRNRLQTAVAESIDRRADAQAFQQQRQELLAVIIVNACPPQDVTLPFDWEENEDEDKGRDPIDRVFGESAPPLPRVTRPGTETTTRYTPEAYGSTPVLGRQSQPPARADGDLPVPASLVPANGGGLAAWEANWRGTVSTLNFQVLRNPGETQRLAGQLNFPNEGSGGTVDTCVLQDAGIRCRISGVFRDPQRIITWGGNVTATISGGGGLMNMILTIEQSNLTGTPLPQSQMSENIYRVGSRRVLTMRKQ